MATNEKRILTLNSGEQFTVTDERGAYYVCAAAGGGSRATQFRKSNPAIASVETVKPAPKKKEKPAKEKPAAADAETAADAGGEAEHERGADQP